MKKKPNYNAIIAVFAFLVVLASALWYYPPLYATGRPASAGVPFLHSTEDRVNVNTAGVEELVLLPGIGEARAENIILYRRQHGKFVVPEDLLQVPGIGEGTLKQIAEWICF